MASLSSWTTSPSRRHDEVELLLERLRRLVRQQKKLEARAPGGAALAVNRREAEHVRWQVAVAVKRGAER
jgi:hypothetical protein